MSRGGLALLADEVEPTRGRVNARPEEEADGHHEAGTIEHHQILRDLPVGQRRDGGEEIVSGNPGDKNAGNGGDL